MKNGAFFIPVNLSVLATVLTFTLAGCSGSGVSSSSSSSSNSGGSTVANASNAVVYGEIQSFYSSGFVLSGFQLDDSVATITINQAGSSDAGLFPGMVVNSVGSINSSNQTISVGTNNLTEQGLVGVVSANSMNAIGLGGTMTVDGQTVYGNPEFVQNSGFDPKTVTVGSYVDINGFSDGSGNFYATLMSKISPSDNAIAGVVANANSNSFTIGGETVNWSGTVTNGQYVQVISTSAPSGNTLTASAVNSINGGIHQFASSGTPVFVEGVITSANSSGTDFFLNGMEVKLTGSVSIKDLEGNTLSSSAITAGAVDHDMVYVQGTVDSSNIIQATAVEFGFGTYNPVNMIMVQSSANTITPGYMIQVAGDPTYSLQQDTARIYLDHSASANRDITETSFNSADNIMILGYEANGHFNEDMAVLTSSTTGSSGYEGVLVAGTTHAYAINGVDISTTNTGLAIGDTVNFSGSYLNGTWTASAITANYGAL